MEAPSTNIFDRSDVKVFFVQYPHIEERLMPLWGTVAGRIEINRLLTDARGGTRQGFLPHFADAIMALLIEHDRRFPGCDQESKTDIIPYRFDRVRWGKDNVDRDTWIVLKAFAAIALLLTVAGYLIKHKELLNGLQ